MRGLLLFFILFLIVGFPLGFLLSAWLPWWSFVALAFVLGIVLNVSNAEAFIGGFVGGAILWGVSAWIVESGGNPEFTDKMAQVLSTSGGGYVYMITIVIGALLGGLGGWSGALLKRAIRPQKRSSVGI